MPLTLPTSHPLPRDPGATVLRPFAGPCRTILRSEVFEHAFLASKTQHILAQGKALGLRRHQHPSPEGTQHRRMTNSSLRQYSACCEGVPGAYDQFLATLYGIASLSRHAMVAQKRLAAFSLLDLILAGLIVSCGIGLALLKNEIVYEKVILRTTTPVTYIAVDSESRHVLAVEDGVFHIINLSLPSRLQLEYEKDRKVVFGAIDANGKTAAVAYEDGTVQVWDQRTFTAKSPALSNPTDLCFLDNDRLLVSFKEAKAKVWKFRIGEFEERNDSVSAFKGYPPVDLDSLYFGLGIWNGKVLFQRRFSENRVLISRDSGILSVIQFANYDYARLILIILSTAFFIILAVRKLRRT